HGAPPGWYKHKRAAAMTAVASAARRRIVARGDSLLDLAGEAFEHGMNRAQIGDEAVRPAQFGTERAVETKVASKHSASFGLVGLVPNDMIKPFHKLSGGQCHALSPLPGESLGPP